MTLDATSTSAGSPPPVRPLGTRAAVGVRLFRAVSARLVVPFLRSGLGAWIASPIGGYLLLLRVRGRRTGKDRFVPLSYLIKDGTIWVTGAGEGASQWHQNLLAEPAAGVTLPGHHSWLEVVAETVTDAEVRAAVLPKLARAMGIPALGSGTNPWRAPAETVVAAFEGLPLVALRAADGSPIEAGPDDPGGGLWILRQGLILGAVIVALRAAIGVVKRALGFGW
ncbi:MAG: nitroreductase/quinone reductase family protein [Chloroflexota bacterium]